MPASIRIAANYFKRDTFSIWEPLTNTFGTKLTGSGRQNRADRFVSLWPRSSRRTHLFLHPDQDAYSPQELFVLRHDSSGDIYLISETTESDFWQGKPAPYDRILRVHKLMPPSGGQALFYPVRTTGTGDNLGPVQIGPPQFCWADTELRTTYKTEGTEETSVGEYIVTYSRNVQVLEGDFLYVRDRYYRVMEEFTDSGFMAVRASQESPKFVTLSFQLTPATASVFDPVTGVLTTPTPPVREVSALIGKRSRAGDTTEHTIRDTMRVFIYTEHIGFDPFVGQRVTYNGVTYRVRDVDRYVEDKQWVLNLEP